jgi:hypothetical protein
MIRLPGISGVVQPLSPVEAVTVFRNVIASALAMF